MNEVSIIRSKGLKNEIAGYITKILKRQQKFEDRKQQLIENDKKLDESEPVSEPTNEKTIAEEVLDDVSEKTS